MCGGGATMDSGMTYHIPEVFKPKIWFKSQLDFIQIYYEESQLSELYPFARAHFNEHLTNYFENSVIADLVPRSNADLISVCSWRLAKKRGDMWKLVDKTLSEEKILSSDFDIAILTPRSPRHQPLAMASQWHGKAWDNAFEVFQREFLSGIGIRIKGELKHAIYENHFIAKKNIYHEYVNNCLLPAIRYLDDYADRVNNPFLTDAGYARRKSESERKRYTEKTGRLDWPTSPFLLERLFSIWIDGKGYKVINL